jgi:hypothetical protein
MVIRHSVILFILILFTFSVSIAASVPWDKPPEKWTLDDVFRILQAPPNFPWNRITRSELSIRNPESSAIPT